MTTAHDTMLEHAMVTGVEDTDFSEFYTDEDAAEATEWAEATFAAGAECWPEP